MRHSKFVQSAASICAIVVAATSAHAASLASDNAGNGAYIDGFQVNDNGGTGFLPWSTIQNASGSGFGGAFISTNNSNVDIGTGAPNAAFGVYGNGGGTGEAIRPFDGALDVGQQFSIDMDNQGIDNNGTVGFALQNSAGQNLVEFYFVGGTSNYAVNGSALIGTAPGYTAGGLHVSVLVGPANTFVLTADPNGATPASIVAGALLNQGGGSAIDRVRLFNANGGPDVFFNNLAITPEPTTLALLGGAGLMGIRRRK